MDFTPPSDDHHTDATIDVTGLLVSSSEFHIHECDQNFTQTNNDFILSLCKIGSY